MHRGLIRLGARRSPRFVGAVLAGFVVLVLAVPACSDSDGRLTVYSGRTEDLIGPLLEKFSDQTGIGVDVRYADSGELALLIDTEGDRTPADVFISQSPGAVSFLDARGRLRPLPQSVVDKVPADDRADDASWVGLTGRVRTLAYNTDLVDPATLPDTVFDLVDPRFRNQIGVAPSNGSFQDFVTAMRAERGDDQTLAWLEGLAANGARTYPNNVSILEAVARGEIEMGLINHYYDFRAKAENPSSPTALHFFDDGDLGGLLLVTAASVLDTTERSGEAERLVDFLLTTEAQKHFSDVTLEYPLAGGVAPAAVLPPLDSVARQRIDFGELGSLDETVALIDESGIAG